MEVATFLPTDISHRSTQANPNETQISQLGKHSLSLQ